MVQERLSSVDHGIQYGLHFILMLSINKDTFIMDMNLTLENTIYTLEQLRSSDISLPQIIFAGRSNVGKSSLINALGARKNLAKVSATPGKTRSLNIYAVRPGNFYLVDLPGYGYARCPKAEREKWSKLIHAYISHARNVRYFIALLDGRLPPQQLDIDLIAFARAKGMPLLPILTKADKCKQQELAKRRHEWQTILNGITPLTVSSKSGLGLKELRSILNDDLLPGKEPAMQNAPA